MYIVPLLYRGLEEIWFALVLFQFKGNVTSLQAKLQLEMVPNLLFMMSNVLPEKVLHLFFIVIHSWTNIEFTFYNRKTEKHFVVAINGRQKPLNSDSYVIYSTGTVGNALTLKKCSFYITLSSLFAGNL